MTDPRNQRAAMYLRVSTSDQDDERQRNECQSYLEANGFENNIDEYADIVTGKSAGRERKQYDDLWTAIGDGLYEIVVVHEISRLSRLGRVEVVEWIEHCMENNTGIKSVGGVGIEIKVDDDRLQKTVYRMIASLMADLAQIEHEQMMKRIESGIKTAQKEGKWTGRPPTGFETVDGYLRVKPEEFLRVRLALERVDRGESLSSVADDTGVPYGTLNRLWSEHADLYLGGEADDDRVLAAVEEQFGDELDDLRVSDGEVEGRLRQVIRDEMEGDTEQ